MVADEWLAQIQVILDFMGISDGDKVKCASFVLKKDARYWWETVILRKDVNRMTWTEFMEKFNSKLFNKRAMSTQQKNSMNLSKEACL